MIDYYWGIKIIGAKKVFKVSTSRYDVFHSNKPLYEKHYDNDVDESLMVKEAYNSMPGTYHKVVFGSVRITDQKNKSIMTKRKFEALIKNGTRNILEISELLGVSEKTVRKYSFAKGYKNIKGEIIT